MMSATRITKSGSPHYYSMLPHPFLSFFIISKALATLLVAILDRIVLVTLFHCPQLVQLHRLESVALVRMDSRMISLDSVLIA